MLPEWSPLRYSTLLDYEYDYETPGLEHHLMDWESLEGWGRYFKKIRKVVKAPFSKIAEVGKKYLPEIVGVAGTIVGGPMLGVTAMTTVAQIKGAEEAEKDARRVAEAEAAAAVKMQADQIAAQRASALAAEVQRKRQEAANAQRTAAARAAAQRATSIPSSIYSTLPGPSFYQAAGGFALPPGTPDQVAVLDQQPTPKQIGPMPARKMPTAAVAALAGVPLLFLLLRGAR